MSYTVNGKSYDICSAVNQRILDRLINREVYCCMTQEIEYMLGRVPFSDHDNPLDESVYDDLFVGSEQDDNEYPAEIFEWWAVSDWFGEKLKEQGQPVIGSVWGKSYWGRTCTGQALSLDGCVAQIAYDMEILEGMENCWEQKA